MTPEFPVPHTAWTAAEQPKSSSPTRTEISLLERRINMTEDKKDKRPKVRAERLDTKCGYIGHMTVDQIKERSFGENVNVACPECGKIHFTVEDIEEAEAKKFRKTKRFARIKSDAEI